MTETRKLRVWAAAGSADREGAARSLMAHDNGLSIARGDARFREGLHSVEQTASHVKRLLTPVTGYPKPGFYGQ